MKIGLEIHIALPTKSKLFCSCSTNASEPNTSICPICMGFPGSKPMLNKAAVSAALGIANALHCKINNRISFARKVYFYPDLPKCYQITQTDGAVGFEGYVLHDNNKTRIRRVQVEEDPAKIVREKVYTLLDFNRAGTPLVEVITEPDIHSVTELRSFLRTLRSILYYLGVDIEKEVKADLNVSVDGERVEVKNVTGVKHLVDAATYEIERQSQLLKEKEKVIRETRAYNEKKRATESMREKETDEEYGYLFEPDLTVFNIDGIAHNKPVYIDEVTHRLAEKYGVQERTLQELTMFDMHSLDLIEKFKGKYKMQSIIHAIQRMKKYAKEKMSDTAFEHLVQLIENDEEITKEIINEVEKGKKVAVRRTNLTDEQVDKLVLGYVKEHAQLLKDYRKNKKAINLIIGEISKQHNLNPKHVAKIVSSVVQKLEQNALGA